MRVKWCSIEKGEKEKHSIIYKIIQMLRLYAKYGNYAEVGRQIGRRSSTVAKYVKMEGVPNNLRIAVDNLIKSNN